MTDAAFDLRAWLGRIGYDGPRAPTLETLHGVIAAQTAAIPFENIDVLLGRTPKLDIGSLQQKLIADRRGGYCFEVNALLRAGLKALGFDVTSLIARVIRGLPDDAERPANHMVLRVALPEGPFLADAGLGNHTPTCALRFEPRIEQTTLHEPMRLMPVGDELVLQVRGDAGWENTYRISPKPCLDIDYEVGNWFTATHPASLFTGNLVAARPGPHGQRHTLLNTRVTIRQPGVPMTRTELNDAAAVRTALADIFGLVVPAEDIDAALAVLARKGTLRSARPSFA